MGALGDVFENDLAKLIFQAVAIANLADNAASAPLTNLYVGLHTASPGEAGTQLTNEATYGAYARVAVARSAAGWTVTAEVITNAGAVAFPTSTGTTNTVTHFSVGTAASGAGKVLFYGALDLSRVIVSGDTPRFAAGELEKAFDN